jgi:hypothetical protein
MCCVATSYSLLASALFLFCSFASLCVASSSVLGLAFTTASVVSTSFNTPQTTFQNLLNEPNPFFSLDLEAGQFLIGGINGQVESKRGGMATAQ